VFLIGDYTRNSGGFGNTQKVIMNDSKKQRRTPPLGGVSLVYTMQECSAVQCSAVKEESSSDSRKRLVSFSAS
jgi:hypothetical protein